MFPSSYFPDGFFAPRYFPKAGLTPPGIIRVIVNNVEVTDLLTYRETISWNLVRGSRGTCTLPFKVEPGDTFAPNIGEVIEIYDPAINRRWFGTVERVRTKWLGDKGWHIVILEGVTVEQLFDTADVDKVKYTGVSCADAFADLHTRSGVTIVGLGSITGATIIESLEVTNIAQGFSAIALLCGSVWYVDPADGNLYLHAPGARASDQDIVSTDVLWESMEWTQSRAELRNTQVVQLPGVSMGPIPFSFAGDDSQTSFVLPSIPEYIISAVVSIGGGYIIGWQPGTAIITVTPAMPTGASLAGTYSDEGLVAATSPATTAGAKTLTFTRTRSFTPAGGLQEAEALVARYSLLPSELTLSTDKAGYEIGRNTTIDMAYPADAGNRLNGQWIVKELNAFIVPGLDQRAEPFGHFRYQLRMINAAATAIFQGDGTTTVFELPVVPTDVTAIRIGAPGRTGDWTEGTVFFTITPALATGQSAAVDYIDPANSPDVPSFVNTWEDMAPSLTDPPVVLSGDPPGSIFGGDESSRLKTFLRTLTLYDLTVGDDIAPHTPVYADGTAYRLVAVLRKDMSADLTVRINKGLQFSIEELITVTIPASAVVDDTFVWSLATGSPAVLGPFFDLEILTADILESDGSTDQNGIVQFTVEWTA